MVRNRQVQFSSIPSVIKALVVGSYLVGSDIKGIARVYGEVLIFGSVIDPIFADKL